jgi:4-hydroxy-tetrahydrodipicolinate synthase
MKNVPFKGIIAYPITPFDENEKVDINLEYFKEKRTTISKKI